jgi:hypothetical protein
MSKYGTFALVADSSLTPLSPLQPETSTINKRYYRLERGVQQRGGFAPSQILSPSQTNDNTRKKNIPV